jgi:hypothetical protein
MEKYVGDWLPKVEPAPEISWNNSEIEYDKLTQKR